jgi:TM2 domain-containing membrane protein YozV
MNNEAAVCVKCGVPTGKGNSYCPNCGVETNPEAVVCVQCGVSLAHKEDEAAVGTKSKLVAGLLGIFLGGFGVHNFYLGFTGKAIAQIVLSFLCGIGGIWGLIDGILILCGKIDKDAKGQKLKD